MNIYPHNISRHISGGAAVIGLAAALVAGAIWHGVDATPIAAATTGVVAAQTTVPAPSRVAAVAGGRDSYAEIVKNVTPAVVTIRVEGRGRVTPTQFDGDSQEFFRRFFGDRFGNGAPPMRTPRQRGLGSGVIVTADGYVLTNNHVVDAADDIRVELTDGRSFKATTVGADKPSDLALLKVEQSGLPTLPLGNSDVVQVGDVVLAVGNPLGIGQTVTMGIVSAKGRSTGTGDGSYEDFLQTDAPINHGNSGGALVNTRGELVGINSQIVSPGDGNIGIGFAIPANMALHVMDQLKSGGRVRRAQLGVNVQPVTSDMAENLGLKDVNGVIVTGVSPGSAAERAGIKRGDVIRSFNGRSVSDFNALRNRVADATPGSSASVVVLRDGSEKSLTAKLDEVAGSRGSQTQDPATPNDRGALGIAVAPLTPELAARAGLDRTAKGVTVRDVDPQGRAADAGIQEGDILLEVNRQVVGSVEDLRSAVRQSAAKPTLLLVRRNAGDDWRDLYVTVRPE